MNNTSVDSYLSDGCGRCDKYQTPDCKVHQWTDALVAMREILRDTELDEEMKWGSPCYTLGGKNVVMITSFKDFCALSFFKGVALDDPDGALEAPGPNSRYMRLLKFTAADEVFDQREQARWFVDQAIEFERSGEEVEVDDSLEPMPIELEQELAADEALEQAWASLTPGRQRSHILHVSRAKKSETRERRAGKCAPKILAGKGYNER